VVEGRCEAIANLEARLVTNGVACKRLESAARHFSPQGRESLAKVHVGVALNPPQIPIVSCITGDWLENKQATALDYWTSHTKRTVRFSSAILKLLARKNVVFLECGPGTGVTQLLRQHNSPRLSAISLKENASDFSTVYRGVSQLWISGHHVNWDALHSGEVRSRLPLPTYPFERRRFWADPTAAAQPTNITPLPVATEATNELVVTSRPARNILHHRL
jgi:acyl transferase domain-containing protein